MKKITIIAITIFFLIKIINLFLADVSFNQGYIANLQGDFESSQRQIENALFLNKHEPLYYRELADSYCAVGDKALCLKYASSALALNPKNSLTLKALIKTFIRYGEKENAINLAEKLVILTPTDPEAQYLLDIAKDN